MGFQVIVQPSGKLALFDGETDKWAAWDATDSEAADWLAGYAAAEARAKAQRDIGHVREGDAGLVYSGLGVMTFAEANARSMSSGGEVLEGPVDGDLLAALVLNDDAESG